VRSIGTRVDCLFGHCSRCWNTHRSDAVHERGIACEKLPSIVVQSRPGARPSVRNLTVDLQRALKEAQWIGCDRAKISDFQSASCWHDGYGGGPQEPWDLGAATLTAADIEGAKIDARVVVAIVAGLALALPARQRSPRQIGCFRAKTESVLAASAFSRGRGGSTSEGT
jgi:hypothetical protein